jgi:invasion protein IalB
MIGSIDGWSVHRLKRRSVLLAALALGFGTTLAIAQPSQPVPKNVSKSATTKTPAAIGGASGAPAPGDQGAGGEWVKVCKTDQGKSVCLINHEGLDPNTGMIVVAAAVRIIDGEAKQSLLINLTTANSLLIPAGIQVKFDDAEPMSVKYVICVPSICQAEMELTKEMSDKMRTGKQLAIAGMNMQQKTMAYGIALTGFSAASDGAPVDNAKYEEARSQMLAQARQRQIELAKNAADAQLRKSQAGVQPQPGGASAPPADPDAVIAPPQ